MFSLAYVDRFDIWDEDAGLTEPSGLVLDPDGGSLWTVSDDTERVFKLALDGRVKRTQCFDVPFRGLEGITIEPTGRYLYAVHEDSNTVIELEIAAQRVNDARALARMTGYDAVARYFKGGGDNKGLEGIAWNEDTGTLFALKEGKPGLIIEVTANLEAILGHAVLDDRNGFLDPGAADHQVDYSGICYDPSRACFWIVSDKAKRVFLYDRAADRAVHSAPLSYAKGGATKEVEKAEGVAYDPRTGRLYVASDEEVRLYVFEVRP